MIVSELIKHYVCSLKNEKQKRQLFRENVLPYLGGKIPDSAFLSDRLALNMLNKEGISIPDGVLFDIRPRESHYQTPRDDPELSTFVLKMVQTSNDRFVPTEGKGGLENEVESTYRMMLPSNFQNYQFPKFKALAGILQIPSKQIFNQNNFSDLFRGQLGIRFDPLKQNLNTVETHRNDPIYSLKDETSKNILEDTRPISKILTTNFICDNSGKLYPDPETQCRVFHLCHFNGFKESFICPEKTRYDPKMRECKFWYLIPCQDIRKLH
ncbi:uncharacterized protein LOC126907117 isoform X2 [Daktulosphaira vitifoliae]|uniref:uncharacterized protein LOC126907117 isoform X2 n=1 Tax=Daktulosphaira vitifoliae TaxID=58002 RepID=UPI0021A99679|nr:uncharacterized protein LOC126907117 isoform X2 [Daktulosphaira vitifoliae]